MLKLKKLLCTLLCAALLMNVGCAVKDTAQTPDMPSQPEQIQTPDLSDDADDAPVYRDQNSEEYRTLYTENPIEAALDERFLAAVTAEDFEALSIDYSKAWREEYHALMEQLIALYPEDAEDLKGLRDYTDEAAQAAYDAEYAVHLYIDEDGEEQVGMAAVQSGNFAMAEIYKDAAIISILNDYREAEPYIFHHQDQAN